MFMLGAIVMERLVEAELGRRTIYIGVGTP
jgi:hypothetical protein